jgi:hypothetical protein
MLPPGFRFPLKTEKPGYHHLVTRLFLRISMSFSPHRAAGLTFFNYPNNLLQCAIQFVNMANCRTLKRLGILVVALNKLIGDSLICSDMEVEHFYSS